MVIALMHLEVLNQEPGLGEEVVVHENDEVAAGEASAVVACSGRSGLGLRHGFQRIRDLERFQRIQGAIGTPI